MWRRSQLQRDGAGLLYCPDEGSGRDIVTLDRLNAEYARGFRPFTAKPETGARYPAKDPDTLLLVIVGPSSVTAPTGATIRCLLASPSARLTLLRDGTPYLTGVGYPYIVTVTVGLFDTDFTLQWVNESSSDNVSDILTVSVAATIILTDGSGNTLTDDSGNTLLDA